MWTVAEHFKVRLGGNWYIDCGTLVVYKGSPLFNLRRRDGDDQLGIDFDVYDSAGAKVATIRNSNVVDGDATNYEIVHEAGAKRVIERSTGRVMAEVIKKGVDGAELDVRVNLYLPNGTLFEATPDRTNLGGIVFKDNTFKGGAAAISIG
jgi:hypothetical protein